MTNTNILRQIDVYCVYPAALKQYKIKKNG